MKSAIGVFIVFFSLLILTLVNANTVNAQVGQLWETIVGNPADQTGPVYDDEGIESGGTGPDDLGPGEFRIPFRCELKYHSSTYSTHSNWSIDINRDSGGRTDEGDPVLASADGVVVDATFNPTPYRETCMSRVVIKHQDGYHSMYGHMSNFQVKLGQRVRMGQKIGEIDDICSAGAWHLHYNQMRGGWSDSDRIKVCFKGYGCDRNSVLYGNGGNIAEKSYPCL